MLTMNIGIEHKKSMMILKFAFKNQWKLIVSKEWKQFYFKIGEF